MLDIFECGKTGQYFYDDLGEFWIHGRMLATNLGFTNPSQSINMYTKPNERFKPENLMGYLNPPWFVNESGVWRLVLKSRNQSCEDFREKLCTEILPAIRKNGGYISDTASLDQLTELLRVTEAKVESMANDLALAELKVQQMAEYIQGETDRTKKAKESVTEDAIKEAVVDYVCVTDDTNGDPLVLQTYLKGENAKYRDLLSTIYDRVSLNDSVLGIYIKDKLAPHTDRFLPSTKS